MSVLNKNVNAMMATYSEYEALCRVQSRTPEPAVNFEDAQEIEDVMASMKGEQPVIAPENTTQTQGGGIY